MMSSFSDFILTPGMCLSVPLIFYACARFLARLKRACKKVDDLCVIAQPISPSIDADVESSDLIPLLEENPNYVAFVEVVDQMEQRFQMTIPHDECLMLWHVFGRGQTPARWENDLTSYLTIKQTRAAVLVPAQQVEDDERGEAEKVQRRLEWTRWMVATGRLSEGDA